MAIARDFTTMALIGAALEPLNARNLDQKIQLCAAFVHGNYDEDLKTALPLFRPMNPEDFPQALENLKEMCRREIRRLFELAELADEARRLEQQQKLAHELRESQKPDPRGTVSELAAQLGVSKSEIRRRRAAGTLDELFASRST